MFSKEFFRAWFKNMWALGRWGLAGIAIIFPLAGIGLLGLRHSGWWYLAVPPYMFLVLTFTYTLDMQALARRSER